MGVQNPAITGMLGQIEHHSALLSGSAAANERAGKLGPEVFQVLLDVGAIHAMVPTALGGAGCDAIDKLRLIETLALIDASTAWVTMATAFCTAAAAAYLPDAAVETIFPAGHRAVIAGAGAPTGIARAIEQVRVGGNWDVIGLRATGSVDFFVDGVFVPEAFTCLSGAPDSRRGSPIFGQSFTLATYIGHSAWALGCARRLLDDLAAFVRTQGQRPNSIAGNHGFQEQYAHWEAMLRAARALTHNSWQNAQDRARAGEMLDAREVTLIRLALVHVTDIAADIANFAFRIAGGETLRQGTMQRLCRDIQAGCQHLTSSPPVKQACGRVLAGLAAGEVWSTNSLVRAAAPPDDHATRQ